ncbi:hypothetical protein [Mesorhizobium marinum]|uniref:hypothetical protein n=1 Tax=Mesorhizobium marinum TaxID=3228790 RepID=UPI003464EE69
METSSKSAFARRLSLSKSRVSQLVAQGMPVNEDGSIPVAEALRWFRANVGTQRGPATASPGAGDLTEEKARLTKIQADRAQLELEARRGDLVPTAIAKRVVGTVARVHRDATLAFAARRGPELAGKWGMAPRQVVADLDAALRVMLEELAAEPIPFPDDLSEPGEGAQP